jgi:tetrahydromethanopterin S-methyltransferase subunit A
MENFGFWLSRTFASTRAKRKTWPYVPGTYFVVDPIRIKLDKAGYFVIHPEAGGILVEHYDYRERLVRIIEGNDARRIYLTLIRHGWVSTLDHAACLGKELTRAELSQQRDFNYVQDGA